MAAAPRMPTSGGLRIGVYSSVPSDPVLMTVTVPPLISSGVTCSLRVRRASSAIALPASSL